MESFVGLLQRLTILEVSECFVEGNARVRGGLIRNTNVDTEQQSTTPTQWEGRHLTALDTPERHLCSWNVLCTGVESNRGKSM